VGEAGDTAYRLVIVTQRSQKLETQLSVRKAAKRVGEEEKEGGKRTEESRHHRGAPGAGGCRTAGKGIAISGLTGFWRTRSASGNALIQTIEVTRGSGTGPDFAKPLKIVSLETVSLITMAEMRQKALQC
jgi:hypothetical protein